MYNFLQDKEICKIIDDQYEKVRKLAGGYEDGDIYALSFRVKILEELISLSPQTRDETLAVITKLIP